MGLRTIKMPDIGEGVAEAEIVEWHVGVGDLVQEDQPVAAVMTDKATVEIPTPVAGQVVALGGAVGDVLPVGSELIRIDAPGLPDSSPAPPPKGVAKAAAGARDARPAEAVAAAASRPAADEEPAARSDRTAPSPPAAARAAPRGAPRPPGEKPLASPAVRLKAREAGVDLRFVPGTGPAGRVTHDDLDAFIAHPPDAPGKGGGRARNMAVETVKIVGMRRRIAQAMAESSRRVAHFSYVEEVDVTALEELRAALNARATAERPRLTVLPFLMLAIVKAVADFPEVNAHFDDDNDLLTTYGAVHLGIATQTPAGLMVPVVRHVETLGLNEASREMRRVSEAARHGTALREELTGSTITLTSLGALGGIVSTPIVNRPEVAIVGVNRIVVKPIWRDGAFTPRKTMNLSSSFDHRVIDGHGAASFIQRVRALVEAPASLFIED
ncbi:branched-chain alpha-keto acid dehydrogenase E2 component [Roseiarcus fermentans]|uniref:Dihydrolipoamide acetyltransferase component of pyruvate dehydrogenase complex n=1 Tax=Roseiarcus fermentans TaxID=1473586 RepID=A0A366FW55_9HYPH|nr:dihydrolipoamide acetyltransferase family protein [Roseiarcus fermentans]RBP18376.1 branched-chain alpha-keto acid dehydrogenase E2 component [Roseiarcus fermentans]